MKKQRFVVLIIVLVIAIVGINVWNMLQQDNQTSDSTGSNSGNNDNPRFETEEQAVVEEGKPAPDFELTTLGGDSIRLSNYKGKKVILNFWATWCGPCKAEMPHMQNFYEKYKDDGVEILAVNLTTQDKGIEAVKSFVKDYELTFQIPLDEDGYISAIYQAFGIPTSYIIDSNGIITERVVGPMDEEAMVHLTENID